MSVSTSAASANDHTFRCEAARRLPYSAHDAAPSKDKLPVGFGDAWYQVHLARLAGSRCMADNFCKPLRWTFAHPAIKVSGSTSSWRNL